MSYGFYKSEEYKKKQSKIVRAAWKRGDFDFTRKKEERVCKRSGCGKVFIVQPSDPKKYCSHSCAAKVNNNGRRATAETREKISERIWARMHPGEVRATFILKSLKKCLHCGKETLRSSYKYCSIACQMDYQYRDYIRRWKAGEIDGLNTIGMVTRHIKRYLREKYDNKCSLCGWSKINPRIGTVPLVADHIDGDWHNNAEQNLRLLCPNCDSLTPTYKGLNRGNGRESRLVGIRARKNREFNANHTSLIKVQKFS